MKKIRVSVDQGIISAAVSSALLLCAAAGAKADAITWSNAGGGNWSTGANWSTGTVPGASDTANLNSTSADRTIIYDTAASGSLGTLSMTQSDPFMNLLNVQRNLTIGTSTSLGASSGTSRVLLNPKSTTSNGTLTFSVPTLTLSGGGVLEMSGYFTNTTPNYTQTSTLGGNLTIAGGVLNVESSTVLASTPTNAVMDVISGNLNMSSGAINLGTAADAGTTSYSLLTSGGYARSTVQRLQISGNLTVTGGSINNSYSGKAAALFLFGTTNSVTGLSSSLSASKVDLGLVGAGAQSYVTDSAVGNLILRNLNGSASIPAVKTVGSTLAGGALNVASINFVGGVNNGTTSLRLASDITLTGGAAPTLSGAGSGTTVNFGVDTNGYTFDLRGVSSGWSLTNVSGNSNVNWSLTNGSPSASTTPGVIKATSFDLSGAASVAVGAYVTLQATGTGGKTNDLSNAGTGVIDARSTFAYAGTAPASNYDLLRSSRAIGNLKVQSGALQLASNIITGAGASVEIAAPAVLDLGGHGLTSDAISVNGLLSGNGTIAGAVTASGTIAPGALGMTLSGTLNVAGSGTVGALRVQGGTLTLGNGSTSLIDITDASTFDVINLMDGGSLHYDGSILSLNFGYTPVGTTQYELIHGAGSGDFSSIVSNLSSSQYSLGFDSASGILTVTEVPEPASLAIASLGAVALLRRRASSRT